MAVGLLEAAGPGEAGLERRELKGTTTGLKSTSGRPGQQGGRHQTAGRSFNGRRLGLAGDCPTEMDVSNKVARIDGGLLIYLLFNHTFTCMHATCTTHWILFVMQHLDDDLRPRAVHQYLRAYVVMSYL